MNKVILSPSFQKWKLVAQRVKRPVRAVCPHSPEGLELWAGVSNRKCLQGPALLLQTAHTCQALSAQTENAALTWTEGMQLPVSTKYHPLWEQQA